MKTKLVATIVFLLPFMLVLNAQTSQKQNKAVSNVKIMHDQERRFYYIANTESGKLIKFLPYKMVNDFKEGMALVETDNGIGFINEQGAEIVPPDGKYQWGRDFSEGMAIVGKKNEKGWRDYAGFINKSGEVIIPLVYQDANNFGEGLAPVKKDNKWGFIDKSGKTIIPFDYYEAYTFSCSLAEVHKKDSADFYSKSGYIDKKGKIVIPIIYKSVSEFHKLSPGYRAFVHDNDDKYYLIDDKGNKLFDFGYTYEQNLYNSQSKKHEPTKVIQYPDNIYWANNSRLNLTYHQPYLRYGTYDVDINNFIVKPIYSDRLTSQENYFVLSPEHKKGVCHIDEIVPAKYNFVFDQDKLYYAIWEGIQTKTGIDGGKYVLYTYSGKKITKYDDNDSYDEITPFFEGCARVKRNGKYGFIDEKGNEIIPLEYDNASVFSSGLVAVSKNAKAGAINKKNQVVIPLEYENLGNFVDGVTFYQQNTLCGLITSKGEKIMQPTFSAIANFSEGLAQFMKDGKIGYLNPQGGVAIPAQYDTGNLFSEGRAMVSINKKVGYIDTKGNLVIPIKYDNGGDFKDGYAIAIEGGKYFLIDKNGNTVKTY